MSIRGTPASTKPTDCSSRTAATSTGPEICSAVAPSPTRNTRRSGRPGVSSRHATDPPKTAATSSSRESGSSPSAPAARAGDAAAPASGRPGGSSRRPRGNTRPRVAALTGPSTPTNGTCPPSPPGPSWRWDWGRWTRRGPFSSAPCDSFRARSPRGKWRCGTPTRRWRPRRTTRAPRRQCTTGPCGILLYSRHTTPSHSQRTSGRPAQICSPSPERNQKTRTISSGRYRGRGPWRKGRCGTGRGPSRERCPPGRGPGGNPTNRTGGDAHPAGEERSGSRTVGDAACCLAAPSLRTSRSADARTRRCCRGSGGRDCIVLVAERNVSPPPPLAARHDLAIPPEGVCFGAGCSSRFLH
mmetsp:Transcript_4297/g.8951  ORF Transcript_4297/g.8951 Transcript_4297/m.8951 type:complete len:356 (+) Transcript_4297:1326-2393(+)